MIVRIHVPYTRDAVARLDVIGAVYDLEMAEAPDVGDHLAVPINPGLPHGHPDGADVLVCVVERRIWNWYDGQPPLSVRTLPAP